MPSTPKPKQQKPTAAHRRFEVFIGDWHAEGTSYGDGQDTHPGQPSWPMCAAQQTQSHALPTPSWRSAPTLPTAIFLPLK